jgi:hypothetical protein
MAEEMTAEQIRHQGLEALKRELGVVGMVRFMQQFSNGKGDYSVDRHQWLDPLTPTEIMDQINALQQRKSE